LRCSSPSSSPTRNPVYVRRVDPSVLVFSLLSHRHSYECERTVYRSRIVRNCWSESV
jgi:hypothetical protein